MASSPQVVAVSKMSAWWMLLIILLILEGGASTIGGDVPEHQDILRIEDRWKEYRGIGREGYFYNESVIAVADYSDDDKESNVDENKLNSNVSKTIMSESEGLKYESVTEADVVDITKVGLCLILCTISIKIFPFWISDWI